MSNQEDPSSTPRHRTRRRALQAGAALALAAGSMIAFGSPSATAAPTTVTFGSGNHLLHLPAGPVTVNFTILGAGGGADGDATNVGGFGGGIAGSFVWTGGKATLSVIVGAAGGNGGPAGTNTRNGGRGGGFNSSNLFAPSLRGHGGNGGTGGATSTTGVVEGGGGGGGGATAVLLFGGVVLVAGGGGGASQFDAGVDGTGNGTVKGLVAGGVGKLGQFQQEGGGGGGGGAVNGVGGGGALPGGGGTGYHHNSGNLALGGTAIGTSNGTLGGGPGADGSASFTGVGIS